MNMSSSSPSDSPIPPSDTSRTEQGGTLKELNNNGTHLNIFSNNPNNIPSSSPSDSIISSRNSDKNSNNPGCDNSNKQALLDSPGEISTETEGSESMSTVEVKPVEHGSPTLHSRSSSTPLPGL